MRWGFYNLIGYGSDIKDFNPVVDQTNEGVFNGSTMYWDWEYIFAVGLEAITATILYSPWSPAGHYFFSLTFKAASGPQMWWKWFGKGAFVTPNTPYYYPYITPQASHRDPPFIEPISEFLLPLRYNQEQ